MSITIEGGSLTAVIGPDDAGRERLAQILSATLAPDSGQVVIGGEALNTIPESVTGARIAYIGPDSYICSGTVGENVHLNLKRFPPSGYELTPELSEEINEARLAGNSPYPFQVEWVSYEKSGFRDEDEFNQWWLDLLRVIQVDDFLFDRGLDAVIDPKKFPHLGSSIVNARLAVDAKLAADPDLEALVRRFRWGEYNTYASVAENVLFGEPTDERLDLDNLANDPYVKEVLEACGLTERLREISLRLVDMMLEMFQGLAPGHPFYEQYSFMDEDLLPLLPDIKTRAEVSIENLSEAERGMLVKGTLMLTPERHRLDLIDDDVQELLLTARRYFRDHLPERLSDALVAFDVDTYLPNTSVMTNALVGRIAFSEAGAERKVREMLKTVFEEQGLRQDIELLVREFRTGAGGSMLPIPARERVALARALGKRPDIIILNQSLASYGDEQRAAVVRNIRELLPAATMIWMDKSMPQGLSFDRIFEVRDSRVALYSEGASEPVTPPAEEPVTGAQDEELDRLAQVPLFSALPRNELKLVALASERRTVQAGENLFDQGDRTDGVYTIMDGELEIVLTVGDREEVLNRLGRGDTVGELGVICDRPRGAAARALEPTTLLFTTTEDVLTLLEHNPGVANTMLRYIGQRFVDSVEQRTAA